MYVRLEHRTSAQDRAHPPTFAIVGVLLCIALAAHARARNSNGTDSLLYEIALDDRKYDTVIYNPADTVPTDQGSEITLDFFVRLGEGTSHCQVIYRVEADTVRTLRFWHCFIDSLSSMIASFPFLRELGFEMGCLAYLPPEIHQLQRLTSLRVVANYVQKDPTLIAPARVWEMTGLTRLEISGPGYDTPPGVLPGEIGNLDSLEWLTIAKANLAALPAQIGNLTRLRHLGLPDNLLTDLPVEVTALAALDSADFARNALCFVAGPARDWLDSVNAGWEKRQIRPCPDIDGLLRQCQDARGLACDTFAVRRILDANAYVHTSTNSVAAVFDGRVVRMDLSGYRLSVLPREIGLLSALKTLRMRNCDLRDLPAEAEILAGLDTLDLSLNYLCSLSKYLAAWAGSVPFGERLGPQRCGALPDSFCIPNRTAATPVARRWIRQYEWYIDTIGGSTIPGGDTTTTTYGFILLNFEPYGRTLTNIQECGIELLSTYAVFPMGYAVRYEGATELRRYLLWNQVETFYNLAEAEPQDKMSNKIILGQDFTPICEQNTVTGAIHAMISLFPQVPLATGDSLLRPAVDTIYFCAENGRVGSEFYVAAPLDSLRRLCQVAEVAKVTEYGEYFCPHIGTRSEPEHRFSYRHSAGSVIFNLRGQAVGTDDRRARAGWSQCPRVFVVKSGRRLSIAAAP